MNAGRVSPSLALAAYAEAWISGAKVIVFGDALSPLAERLIERGARHVHVYDSDAERAAEAAAQSQPNTQISYGPLEQAGSTLRDGVFDVGIIEDLAAAQHGPEGLLAPLGRALSRRGMALIASKNPDVPQRLLGRGASPRPARAGAAPAQSLGYYDFYDAVSRHFDEVRMLGQAPFVGYAIADFSATDAADVRIDTAFLPSGAEEPEWFLALASALPVSPDAFSVIQLPLAELDLGPAEGTLAAERAEQAEARAATLEAALTQLRTQRSRESTQEHKSQVSALKAELAKREEWLTGLEARAATADLRADEMQSELGRLSADNLKARQALKQLEQLVETEQRAKKILEDNARAVKLEIDKLRNSLEAETRRASKADAEARSLTQRLAQLGAELAESERQRKLAESDQQRKLAESERQRKLAESERQRKQLAESERQRKQLAESEQQRKQLAESEQQRKQLAESEQQRKQLAESEQQRKQLAESEQQRKQLAQREQQRSAEIEQLRKQLTESERQRKQLAEASADEVQPELRELEASLVERGTEVGRLSEALHKTERFGRQLIVELNQLKTERASSEAARTLAQLTERNAQLEADLEAARWTISSLEANVGTDPTAHPLSSPTQPPSKRRDEAAHSEPFVPSSTD